MSIMFRKEYLCYFEGQQEEMYFKHISKLIKQNYENANIVFKKISKIQALSRSSTNIPKIAVFDYDNNKVEFEKKVKIKDIKTVYTSLNFDLWLLLHKSRFNKTVQNNNSYITKIKNAYNLGLEEDIKKERVMEKILNNISIDDVRKAINNGNEIMNLKNKQDRKIVNRKFYYYDNPSMNINDFFSNIFNEIEKQTG